MAVSEKAQNTIDAISGHTKLGDLRKMAAALKKNHPLAMELWSTGKVMPRLLAILIMDKKALTVDAVGELLDDLQDHQREHRNQLADWLMANQLMKDKKTIGMIESWEDSPMAVKRRMYWYYQGRLRWVGQNPPDNTDDLLAAIDAKMPTEDPDVQWAMNFTAGWIGIFDASKRQTCIDMGMRIGLYKDEIVAKGCSPDYLPMFIETEVRKRSL